MKPALVHAQQPRGHKDLVTMVAGEDSLLLGLAAVALLVVDQASLGLVGSPRALLTLETPLSPPGPRTRARSERE